MKIWSRNTCSSANKTNSYFCPYLAIVIAAQKKIHVKRVSSFQKINYHNNWKSADITKILIKIPITCEPRSEKTGLNDILEFLCKKHLKNTKKLRNLTCLYIALKSIQVDSQLKLENISDETFFDIMQYVAMATALP